MSESANESLELSVARAKEGDRAALDHVVKSIQGEIYRLALRFLWHPDDAEDADRKSVV